MTSREGLVPNRMEGSMVSYFWFKIGERALLVLDKVQGLRTRLRSRSVIWV